MPRGGSAYAWWHLSQAQKQTLDAMRNGGMFGGTPAHPKYFWVQEGTLNPAGAAKAGIRPTHWLDFVLENAPIEDAIASVLSGS